MEPPVWVQPPRPTYQEAFYIPPPKLKEDEIDSSIFGEPSTDEKSKSIFSKFKRKLRR